jgi:hypothetical protein
VGFNWGKTFKNRLNQKSTKIPFFTKVSKKILNVSLLLVLFLKMDRRVFKQYKLV